VAILQESAGRAGEEIVARVAKGCPIYIVVNAPDLAAATAIARACPGLDLGSTIVEVRPVEPLPPL
jgi:hypothetical protein